MPTVCTDPFPGADATAAQVHELAAEYRRAAGLLAVAGVPGRPLTRSPYRLLVIQAVELYLNGYLLAHGQDSAAIRRLHHDLGARARLAVSAGLVLRARTLAHLEQLAANREYLTSRYATGAGVVRSNPNRLAATLDEVASKVTMSLPAASRLAGDRHAIEQARP